MTSYEYIRSEPFLWTVGFYKPDGTWEPDSDHSTSGEAANRARWINGDGGGWVYLRSESHLWTVGHYDGDGGWKPESDHDSQEKAAERVAELNSSGGAR